MSKVSKEDFNKVFKDTTKEEVLNQFYYEHYDLINALEKIDKAIELTKIRIESCNACLSNDETSIISKHSLLRLEIQSCKELLAILGDKENENN